MITDHIHINCKHLIPDASVSLTKIFYLTVTRTPESFNFLAIGDNREITGRSTEVSVFEWLRYSKGFIFHQWTIFMTVFEFHHV